MPAAMHHSSIPTPNMMPSVVMLPTLSSVLLLVQLWPFKPWLSSFRMNALALTRGLCLMLYYCHLSSHYSFPPCCYETQERSSNDRKNHTKHERPQALPFPCHNLRIYFWPSYSCLLVYMIDRRDSAQTAERTAAQGECIGEYICEYVCEYAHRWVEPSVGIEPTTSSLQERYSTNWANSASQVALTTTCFEQS